MVWVFFQCDKQADAHFFAMTLTGDRTAVEGHNSIEMWRLVVHHDSPGAYLMALDEALLESVIAGGAPVIRFYTWQPATLSLGVNQPLSEVRPDECDRLGFSVVRRLTGGRAVLHQHELTYSVIARENNPRVSGGVIESYRKISAALVEGLQSLGADVSLAEPSRALLAISAANRQVEAQLGGEIAEREGSHGAVCFSTASAYEITARGRKLVGSAQARRGGAILQHGSILLDIDWDAWVDVFSYATEAGKQRACAKLPARMTSLREELGRTVGVEGAQHAIAQAIEKVLKIELTPTPLSAEEDAVARKLARDKYEAESWTGKI